MHPGANHASIHNWDGLSPEQALASCELYGKSAPDVPHAMHMPGRIYSKVGMWNEAAIAMDSATRTELRYMNDRLALPFETWNYSHNRNYLCYIQEQLGMAKLSLQGSTDMLASPRDPDYNSEQAGQNSTEGLTARVRALIKIAEGIINVSDGQFLKGQRHLLNVADIEKKFRDKCEYQDDPPGMPWSSMQLLGDCFRKNSDMKSAIDCYERALKNEPNNAFALSGLALAHFANGNREKATTDAGRLEYVWSQADPNSKWLEDVRKLGLNAKPIAETARPERTYHPKDLDVLGPVNWQPYQAPNLQVVDKNGKKVSLQDFKGKNILLVFFLGDACVHCGSQLKSLNDKSSDFEEQETVLLGVCSATPEKLKQSTKLDQSSFKFLSDNGHENARRFASYDDF